MSRAVDGFHCSKNDRVSEIAASLSPTAGDVTIGEVHSLRPFTFRNTTTFSTLRPHGALGEHE